jgi:hypothetical protein
MALKSATYSRRSNRGQLFFGEHVIQDGHGHPGQKRGRDFARHEGHSQTLENRVEQNHSGARDHGGGGQQHGTKPHRARVDHRFFKRHPFGQTQVNKIH